MLGLDVVLGAWGNIWKGGKVASPRIQPSFASLLAESSVTAQRTFFSLMKCSRSFPNIWEQKREGSGESFMVEWARILTVASASLLSISLAKYPNSLWNEKTHTERWFASQEKKMAAKEGNLPLPKVMRGSRTSMEVWGPRSGSAT